MRLRLGVSGSVGVVLIIVYLAASRGTNHPSPSSRLACVFSSSPFFLFSYNIPLRREYRTARNAEFLPENQTARSESPGSLTAPFILPGYHKRKTLIVASGDLSCHRLRHYERFAFEGGGREAGNAGMMM